MGLLNLFSKPAPALLRLPSGSFTVDRQGSILASTLPSTFPPELIDAIAQQVTETFRGATAAQILLTQIQVSYPTLSVNARELRGGAIVFLAAKSPFAQVNPVQQKAEL
jgi:hypothetical protein